MIVGSVRLPHVRPESRMYSEAGVLSEPFSVGPLVLRNRIVSAPMERNYCHTDGTVDERYVAYLAKRAAGGAALVATEAAYVRQDGKGRHRQMGTHDDAVITGLSRLARAVHREGALVAVELNHGGRTSQAKVSGLQPVAPSPVPCDVAGGDLPIELDTDEIYALVEAFAEATRRCREAGIDMVTVHGAHGYLIHQFMSPRTNWREDEWADPALFMNEVLRAVRDEADHMAVGLRISAIEGPPGGLDADATLAVMRRVRLDLVDAIDVSAGCYEAREWIVQPGEWPQGLLRGYARCYREFGRPVGVAGRINSPEVAEDIVASGDADWVTLARALHADPDWPRKVFSGEQPRPCIACNLCIDELGSGEPIPCTVNPEVGLEYLDRGPRRIRRPRRVTIVGAGPAGLEAARKFALAGCDVRLYERATELGGQFLLAARLREYPEYGRILRWYDGELAALGVCMQLGVDAGVDLIDEGSPDVVVLATGGRGHVPELPGSDLRRVVDVRDWLRAQEPILPGHRYTVWGTDREGIAVADDIVARGGRVLLVGGTDELAPDVGARAKILVVPRLLDNPDVEVELSARILEIRQEEIVLAQHGAVRVLPAPGTVLVSQGVQANTTLLGLCREIAPPFGVYTIGDAAGRGGRAAECIADGAGLVHRVVDGR